MTVSRLLACIPLLAMCATIAPAATEQGGAAAIVDNLAAFRFDKLGHPQIQSDSIQPVLAPVDRPHRLLILPVRFSDKGYDRFEGDPAQDDKNRDWFQELLFAGGAAAPEAGTLSHYYRHQSRGQYNITGDIFPVVQLDQPLHHYGRPVQNSDGSWRNDERSTELVVDALMAAYAAEPDFPWADYDIWDPTDFDDDGVRDEPDGYLDHFVLIVAGKGQASCHGLYKLNEKLNENAKPDAFHKLPGVEQDCADRLWPHRFKLSQNLGKGPRVGDKINARGGVDLGNGMWVLDYNMQSEYTEVSTFIHEFGHSLGLPDVYARQTSNSSGSWEAMSATTSPLPQELSAWSRTVLGWMQPCVVRPTDFGGNRKGSLHLKTMNDWSGKSTGASAGGACDAAMVILPPKIRDIELGPLAAGNGKQAVYSGQGNDMLRSLSRQFDFSAVEADESLVLSLDTWFEIEAEWDYFYVEVAGPGEEFRRIMPMDKAAIDDKQSVMPSGKGHEGKGSVPGFTGLSGDRDGDGKVESAEGCDPGAERTLAEDRVGTAVEDPCETALWVNARFDLSDYRGGTVTVRFTYFTDGAAVENGALIDNVRVDAIDFNEDFESEALDGWASTGFTLSGGSHRLAVPHFYLLEYRDPYAVFDRVKNYDASLNKPGFVFSPDGEGGYGAVNANYRPGVVMWYYNGEYLWSQNEPAESGPGRGFLLVVDSTPQEFELPSVPEQYFMREDGWTWWQFDEAAQPWLRAGYVDTMCFQRRPAYYSLDVTAADRERCEASLLGGKPPMEAISWENRPLTYGYTIINELLPGPERMARKGATTLFDLRLRKGQTQFRIYDRILRNWHSADAPFAIEPFDNGLEFFAPVDGEMRRVESRPFAPVSSFSDAPPNRYQNPHLPFGGADIPSVGFSYTLKAPGRRSPEGSRVRVDYRFR